MLGFLVALACVQQPCASQSEPKENPVLVVQVVDEGWFALPGADVTVKQRGGDRKVYTAVTREDGFAYFWLPRELDYDIEASLACFKKRKMDRVHVGKVSNRDMKTGVVTYPSMLIQIRTAVSCPMVTVY